MVTRHEIDITAVIGNLPYRMALAGGWIDQPFVSKHNPTPPGSMVVVGIEPSVRYMDRSGMATSTRQVAARLWDRAVPDLPVSELIRALYAAENDGRAERSGSQDMAGLILPGVNRLDYDFAHEAGYFPVRIESSNDPVIAQWLETVIHVLPVAQRPEGYSPLGEKHLNPEWISCLGKSGKDCYEAILRKDAQALGASMNESMRCWQAILPNTVRHPAITVDLLALLDHYQSCYAGAMYSGCGGGYLYVVSEGPVPGSFQVKVRRAR